MTKYIQSTNYFQNRWTWILRAFRFLMAIAVLYMVDLQELSKGDGMLTFSIVFMAILAVFFYAWPVDELAVDIDTLHFIRKSAIPLFNRKSEIRLSELKSIGAYNISKPVSVFALFVPVFNMHRVELIYTDNSSRSLDLNIQKMHLKRILAEAKTSIKASQIS